MRLLAAVLFLPTLLAAELPDIRSVPADLEVPALSAGPPAAGKRVRHGLGVLYLPADWKADVKWPVIVELAGNGGYTNKFGDVSTGQPEGSNLGYGLSTGRGFIWLCVPYLNTRGDQIAIKWWGDAPDHDPQPTLRNLREAVTSVCREFSGDESRVVLAGFSRGAIACN
jgi:poly(3-hydroxybutyrate) depolymerase